MENDSVTDRQSLTESSRVLIAVPAGPDDDAEIEIGELLKILWKSRFLAVSVVMGFTVIAILLSFLVTKTYSASTVLSPVKSEQGGALASLGGQLQGIASLAGVSVPAEKSSEEAIATLKSRTFIEAFIKENDLLPKLFADSWDDSENTWGQGHADEPPTTYEGYQDFVANVLSVGSSADTGLVTLSIEWHEPVEARDWANGLVERINERLRADAITEAQESLEYLNQELAKTQIVELRQGIYRLIENQINTIMLANVREEFAFKVIDPAVTPNERDKVRPKRVIFAFAGFLLGCLVALALAFRRQVDHVDRSAATAGSNG